MKQAFCPEPFDGEPLCDHLEENVQEIATDQGIPEQVARRFVWLRDRVLWRMESHLKNLNLAQDRPAFIETVRCMRHHLAREDNPIIARLLMGSRDLEALKQALRPPNNAYIRLLENEVTLRVIADSIHNLNDPNWETLLASDDELLARMSSKSQDLAEVPWDEIQTSVVVGSGTFPETLIFLHQHTPVPYLIGIDREAVAYDLSSRIIYPLQKHHQEKRLRLYCTLGEEYHYAGVDHVHIAGFVPTKANIIKRIVDTSDAEVKLITVENYVNGCFQLLHDDVEQDLPACVKIDRRKESISPFVRKEILYLTPCSQYH